MEWRRCVCCDLPVQGRKRKYCDQHSRTASTRWKRAYRLVCKRKGDQYWLSDWKNKTTEERRAYFRDYMRKYRRRLRVAR